MGNTSLPNNVGGQGRKTSIAYFSTKRNTNEPLIPTFPCKKARKAFLDDTTFRGYNWSNETTRKEQFYAGKKTERAPGSYEDFVAYLGTVRTEEELFSPLTYWFVGQNCPEDVCFRPQLVEARDERGEVCRLLVCGERLGVAPRFADHQDIAARRTLEEVVCHAAFVLERCGHQFAGRVHQLLAVAFRRADEYIQTYHGFLLIGKTKKGELLISHRYDHIPLLDSSPGGFCRSWSYKTHPGTKVGIFYIFAKKK